MDVISDIFGFFARGSVAGNSGSGAIDTVDRTMSWVLQNISDFTGS